MFYSRSAPSCQSLSKVAPSLQLLSPIEGLPLPQKTSHSLSLEPEIPAGLAPGAETKHAGERRAREKMSEGRKNNGQETDLLAVEAGRIDPQHAGHDREAKTVREGIRKGSGHVTVGTIKGAESGTRFTHATLCKGLDPPTCSQHSTTLSLPTHSLGNCSRSSTMWT
jgi:hypothetical protein